MLREGSRVFCMRAVCALYALAASVSCTFKVPFAERMLFSTARAEIPSAEDCARCHHEVYEEWRDSLHAHAWSSARFAALTADHEASACLSCHAPAPLGPQGEVSLRADRRSEGVTCITCHLSTAPHDGALAMRGPHERTTPIEVHPVVRDPLFIDARLCGSCHEQVLEEWRASPAPSDGAEKATCQSCHMAAVRRTIENYNPSLPYSALFVTLATEIEGRRHGFAVPEDLEDDIELRVSTTLSGVVEVAVTNRLPHAIPTGAFGRRELRLRVRDASGESLRTLRADLGERIAAGQTRSFAFPERSPNGLDVSLERRAAGAERYVPLVASSGVGSGERPPRE